MDHMKSRQTDHDGHTICPVSTACNYSQLSHKPQTYFTHLKIHHLGYYYTHVQHTNKLISPHLVDGFLQCFGTVCGFGHCKL